MEGGISGQAEEMETFDCDLPQGCVFVFCHSIINYQKLGLPKKYSFVISYSQGRGSLVGCPLWGHIESDMTEAT